MRYLFIAFLALPTLVAQNFHGQIQVRPLLPPIGQPWNSVLTARNTAPQARQCSVPLLQITPRQIDPRIFIQGQSTVSRMPGVTVPAPPCQTPQR